MSERTKIKETITAGEYGDYKLVFGYDGSNWRPILVHSSGKLEVIELNSGDIKLSLQKIDDLQGALKSVDTDELIARLVTTGGVEINPAKEDGNLVSIKDAVELLDNALDTAGDDHLRVLPPEMSVYFAGLTTSNQKLSIVVGAGTHCEVFGFTVATKWSGLTSTAGAYFGFPAGNRWIWGSPDPDIYDAAGKEQAELSNLRIKGADGEELDIYNATFSVGTHHANFMIFYRII